MAKAKKSQSAAAEQALEPVLNLASGAKGKKTKPSTEPTTAPEDLGAEEPIQSRRHPVVWTAVVILLVAALFGGFDLVYAGKVFPGVSMNGIYLGGLTREQAKTTLAKAQTSYVSEQVPVQYANTTLSIDIKQIGTSYDLDQQVSAAYAHGHQTPLANQLRQIARSIVGRPTRLSQFSYDDAKLVPYVKQISDQIDSPVANAALSFSETGRVEVTPEQAGQRLDIGQLVAQLKQRIATSSSEFITAPVYPLSPSIDAPALTAAKAQADTYLQGPLTLTAAGKTLTVTPKDITGWIAVSRAPVSVIKKTTDLTAFYGPGAEPVTLSLSDTAIATYVAGIAKTIDRPSQNAQLSIQDNKATVFQPSQTGFTLDQAKAVADIKAGLAKAGDRQVALDVKAIQPDVTEQNLNDLGINELISEGVTYFPGSPATRMQNIRVGAARFNGVLVKPGDVFSFESLLGDVGPATGYAPSLVILGNKEVYQYGGGMCQVSSTAYRAALLAGLPIVERHNHSFAVGYYTAPYGVPGVDATVYDLSVDFKFRNDTGHYILIQTNLQGTTLKFDFYGTKTKSGQIRGPYFIDPAGGAGWNATIPSKTVFYRDVLDLSGNVIKTDTVTTSYKSSLDFPIVKELN